MKKYWIRTWTMDWYNYWQDSPDFDTREEALSWQALHDKYHQESVLLWREVDEVLGTDNQPIQS